MLVRASLSLAWRSPAYLPEAERRRQVRAEMLKQPGELHKRKKRWADAARCFQVIVDLRPRWRAQEAALAEVRKAMANEQPTHD